MSLAKRTMDPLVPPSSRWPCCGVLLSGTTRLLCEPNRLLLSRFCCLGLEKNHLSVGGSFEVDALDHTGHPHQRGMRDLENQ